MLSDKLFGSKPKLIDLNGHNLRFMNFKNGSIRCYRLTTDTEDSCTTYPTIVKPEYIAVSDLHRLQIWDKLSAEKQAFILNGDIPLETNDNEKKRGRKTRSDYSHIPRSFSCTCCDNVVSISPGVMVTKLGLKCQETDEEMAKISEFKKNFKCSTCSPSKRGRTRNPLFKDIPKSFKCSDCQKEIVANSKAIYDLTKGDIDAIKVYIDGYLCRKCNPDWGSWLKGKRGKKKIS